MAAAAPDLSLELPKAVGAGPARRQAVARAGKTFPQLASFQLCDFDRLITWCEEYPDELSALSCQPFPTNTFCILGRTKKVFLSHPTAWQRTEKLVNEIAAEVFHIKGLDITAGSVLFSAELIPLLSIRRFFKMDGWRMAKLGSEASWRAYFLLASVRRPAL
ncbi:MAG: hypothetical protein ACLRKY_11960 [Enterococcus gallinarum]